MSSYEVRNGKRLTQFEGVILGHSSSRRRDSVRWIEFTLYKTVGGSYILNRVGVSLIFHTAACSLVAKYGLHERHYSELSNDAVRCPDCSPSLTDPLVFPEVDRHWTLVSEDAQAVVDSLYKEGDHGFRYLTNVAERLLDSASSADPEIDLVYRFDYID